MNVQNFFFASHSVLISADGSGMPPRCLRRGSLDFTDPGHHSDIATATAATAAAMWCGRDGPRKVGARDAARGRARRANPSTSGHNRVEVAATTVCFSPLQTKATFARVQSEDRSRVRAERVLDEMPNSSERGCHLILSGGSFFSLFFPRREITDLEIQRTLHAFTHRTHSRTHTHVFMSITVTNVRAKVERYNLIQE